MPDSIIAAAEFPTEIVPAFSKLLSFKIPMVKLFNPVKSRFPPVKFLKLPVFSRTINSTRFSRSSTSAIGIKLTLINPSFSNSVPAELTRNCSLSKTIFGLINSIMPLFVFLITPSRLLKIRLPVLVAFPTSIFPPFSK